MIYIARKIFLYKNELIHAGVWGLHDYIDAYFVISEHVQLGISNYVDAIVHLRSDYWKKSAALHQWFQNHKMQSLFQFVLEHTHRLYGSASAELFSIT